MANVKMFQQIHELITAHPERHNQESWEIPKTSCETTRCVAGWAVYLKAREMGMLANYLVDSTLRGRMGRELGTSPEYSELAAHILGLHRTAADSLFYDFDNVRVAARVKSYAETGEDLPGMNYDD